MPFCVNCGKPLADGEVCNCQNDTINTTPNVAPAATPVITEPVEAPVVEAPVAEAPAVDQAPVECPDFEIPTANPTPVAAPVNPTPVETPVTAPAPEASDAAQSLAYATPNKKKNKTALAVVAGIIVIAVIAIVFLLAGNLFGGSKKPLDEILKSINSKETDFTVLVDKALPGYVADNLNSMVNVLVKTDEYEDVLENFSDSMEDLYDELEDEFGKKWSMSFDAKETDLDKDELEDIAELYEDFYSDYLEDVYESFEDIDDDVIEDFADNWDLSEKDAKKFVDSMTKLFGEFENIKVTDGYELKGKFVITSKDNEDKSDKYTINIIKLNGEWTIDYLSLLDELGISIDTLLYYLGIY